MLSILIRKITKGEFMVIKQLKNLYFRLPIIIKLLIFILLLMFVYGFIIHLVEPEQFPTIFDGVWWAFVTGATVGYGDYVPLTLLGKIIAIFLILTGGGLIAFYISSISSETIKREQNLEKGKIKFKGDHHFVFIGWNERTRKLIELTSEKHPNTRIVLIDRTVREISYPNYPVHFIHGDAGEDETLEKANLSLASRVLISSDGTKNERQADRDTILTTVAIRGNNKDVPIIAEILTQIQIENALRAGATTIIRSNDFMSSLFFHELSHRKTATPFEDIIQILYNQQFSHMNLPAELVGQSFLEASYHMMQRRHLLLGVIRDETYELHPSPSFSLKEGDILVSLVDWSNNSLS